MIVDNLDKIVNEPCDVETLLEMYSLDEIQIMMQQNTFDLYTTMRLRPYLKSRVIEEQE